MQVTENRHLPQEQNQNQDMGIEHKAVDSRQGDSSTHHLLSSGQHQCRRNASSGWKCQGLASPGNIYCDKHRLEQDKYNEKKRNARKKKENPFLMDPVLHSGERQCRRTGRGWRCSHLAPPSKIYCQKHELEQNAYCENKKEYRKRKGQGLIGCDEVKSSSDDCLTVSKRIREKEEGRSIEDVRVENLKIDFGKDVAIEEPVFPVNEGVVDEHADKNLSIAQTDSAQLLSPTLNEPRSSVHEKVNLSQMEDSDGNHESFQPKPAPNRTVPTPTRMGDKGDCGGSKDLPLNHQRCIRNDGKNWRCKEWRLQDKMYCQKHIHKERKGTGKGKGRSKATKPTKEINVERVGETEETHFTEGQEVEVTSLDEGFEDAWFTARIIRLLNIKTKKILVEYDTLLAEKKQSVPLRETVDPCMVRPRPPSLPKGSFHEFQIVDAFHNDGWWKGRIVEVFENSSYMVNFPDWEEDRMFGSEELRVHQDWAAGKWVFPPDVDDNAEATDQGQQTQTGAECIDVADESCKRKRETSQSSPKPYKKMKLLSSVLSDTCPTASGTIKHRTPNCCGQTSPTIPDCDWSAGNLGNPSETQVECLTRDEINKQNESVEHQTIAILETAMLPGENSQYTFPFEKSHDMWGILKNWDVFRAMPQNPHFRPLSEENEFLREGQALGYMLSFAAMAANVRKIKYDEANNAVEENLKALEDFEVMGFDVELVRSRLNKLVTIKAALRQCDAELIEVKEKIVNEKMEEEEVKLKIDENNERQRELEETLFKLKEKKEVLVIQKQSKHSGLAAIQKSLLDLKEDMRRVDLSFSRAAARPW